MTKAPRGSLAEIHAARIVVTKSGKVLKSYRDFQPGDILVVDDESAPHGVGSNADSGAKLTQPIVTRAYTLAEIDSMRESVSALGDLHSREVEDRLRTYMVASVEPSELLTKANAARHERLMAALAEHKKRAARIARRRDLALITDGRPAFGGIRWTVSAAAVTDQGLVSIALTANDWRSMALSFDMWDVNDNVDMRELFVLLGAGKKVDNVEELIGLSFRGGK